MPRAMIAALVLLVSCADAATGPAHAPVRSPAFASDGDGPPNRSFGPDSYRTGVFTGEGTTDPGLECRRGGNGAMTCSGFLASAVDGARLDVTLQLPPRTGERVPLVVVVHGYGGSKSSSASIVDPLLQDRYAVLRYSTRGFGDSWGQVNMVDVHAEVADLRSMIGQVVDRQNFLIDPAAVAVAGASYGGGHAWLAALAPTFTTPKGNIVRIRAVVPIAAWSDLLYSLVPNGRERESVDRPGGAKLSYINGLYASGVREDPERPYPNYPEYFIAWHAWINAQEPTDADPLYQGIEDGLAGYRSAWWRPDFWNGARSADRVPLFVVQGFTDDLFPYVEAKRMVLALQAVDPAYPVTTYLGDIGHPRASNKTGEVDHVLALIRSWLAFHLRGVGTAPSGVYAALTRPRDEPFDAGNVLRVPTLGALSTGTVSHAFADPAVPHVLVNPLTDPASGFFWDPLVMEGARELRPLPLPPESPLVPGTLATYDLPLSTPHVVAGQPAVSLHARTLAHRVQLNVRLFDVSPSGAKRLLTRGTHTLDSGSPAVPLGDVDVTITTYGNYWRAEAGHTLRVELTNVDSPYITPSRVPGETTITGVRLHLPVRN